MPRYIFPASSVSNATGAPLRLQFHFTQTGGQRATDLWTVDGSNYVDQGISNGIVVTTSAGAYSAFAGPDDVDTLWIAPSNGAARTSITATGYVAGENTVLTNTFGQVWATPTASTTLTGTLAAWTITAVDCTAGQGARTLPAASSVAVGTAVCAKKADTSANTLVVSRTGSDLIYGTGSGATSKTLSLSGEAVEFVSNGVDKWTVRSSDTPSGALASTYLSQTSATSTYSPISDYFEQVPLYIYGHSFTMVPAAFATNGGEWQTRLGKRLGMQVTNKGVTSLKMSDVVRGAIGTARPLGTDVRGVVCIEALANDLYFEANTANAAYQAGFKNSLRAFIAAAIATSRIEAQTATQSGTWGTLTDTSLSGGTLLDIQTQNAYLEWTGVSAPAGYIYVLSIANDNAAASVTGTFAVSVDGVDQGIAYSGKNGMKNYTAGGGGSVTFSPTVVKVTVSSTGTHTIRVTKTDASPTWVWVDALLPASASPPAVFVIKDPGTDSTASATVGGTLASAYTTYAPTYNALIDAVVAEFPGIAYAIDLAPGWVPGTMQGATDTVNRFHPNDVGMAYIASTVYTAIKANRSFTSTGITLA